MLDVHAKRPVAIDRADDRCQPVQQRLASWWRLAAGKSYRLVTDEQLARRDDMGMAQRTPELPGGLPPERLHIFLAAGCLDQANRGRDRQPPHNVHFPGGTLVDRRKAGL